MNGRINFCFLLGLRALLIDFNMRLKNVVTPLVLKAGSKSIFKDKT